MDLGRFEETPNFFFSASPHTVDFYEIFFFRKASGTLQLDNHLIELKPDLIVFATPFQRRRWQVSPSEIEGHFLIFANQFLELFFTDPLFVFRLSFFYNAQDPPWIDSSARFFNAFAQHFLRMEEELQRANPDSEEFLRAYLLLILAELNRHYGSRYQLSTDRRKNLEAYRFKQLVETKIRTQHRVEDYAKALQINRVTLNKLVKKQFGITASQFIKRRLLTEIKRELLFSNHTISEIAFKLCFSESSSLIRFFQSQEGCSPSQYRIQRDVSS